MRTREMILETVKKLLSEKDINKIRIQDICSECGISKVTFYNHFRDKFDAANTFYFDNLVEEGIILNSIGTHRERLLRQLNYFKNNADVFVNLMSAEGQDSFAEYVANETFQFYYEDLVIIYGFTPTEETRIISAASRSRRKPGISARRIWPFPMTGEKSSMAFP